MITIGLSEIKVAPAAPNGTMPQESAMTKIGKTYKDTAKISQEQAEVTEHFEEGRSAPEVLKKNKKIPKLTFSIMDADIDARVAYIGGTKVPKGSGGKTKWAFDGNEPVENKAILVKSEQGLNFEIPNADIEAVIDADMSAKGIFLVNFTVTPCAVATGKALRAYDPKET